MMELNEGILDDLNQKIDLKTVSGIALPVIKAALAPVVWNWYKDNKSDVIVRYKARLLGGLFRPSISIKVELFYPLLKSIFGTPPFAV